jgi:DNA-binding CsgD family transcriptional regulator
MSPRARLELKRRRDREQTRDRRWPQTNKRIEIVANLTSTGWSASEIARHLGVTPRSVERYRARINEGVAA